jgi:hypothetical protein
LLPKLAVCPIHKLAVIVPVDYCFEEDLVKAECKGAEESLEPLAERRSGKWGTTSPNLEEEVLKERPRRRASQKAAETLKRGAGAVRGRGTKKSRIYQGAGSRG